MTKLGIFTKPVHVEQITNMLSTTDLKYFISTRKDEMYRNDFDVGVSYCYPYLVNVNYPLKEKRIWYNYHPAPLPKYPGIMCLVDAINDKVTEFGVTLHIMNEKFDDGKILKIKTFKLNSVPISVQELGNITHYHLYQLFKDTIKALPTKPKELIDLYNKEFT